jgi:hypothetical protein
MLMLLFSGSARFGDRSSLTNEDFRGSSPSGFRLWLITEWGRVSTFNKALDVITEWGRVSTFNKALDVVPNF